MPKLNSDPQKTNNATKPKNTKRNKIAPGNTISNSSMGMLHGNMKVFLISNKNGCLETRRLLPKPGPGFPNTLLKTCYQLLQTLHNKDVVFVHVALQSKHMTKGFGSCLYCHAPIEVALQNAHNAADYQLKQLLFFPTVPKPSWPRES